MSSTLFNSLPRRLIGCLRQEHGQSMVEFAVVLPVLMLIIVGILTFGRYTNYSNQETHLASQAARWAAVNFDAPGAQTLQAYVRSQTQGELLNGSTDVSAPIQVYLYYPTGSSNTVGSSLRACVTATVNLLPMLGAATSLQLVETSTMRVEQPATNWSTAGNSGAVPSQCPTS